MLSMLQDTLLGRMLHLTQKISALALFAYVVCLADSRSAFIRRGGTISGGGETVRAYCLSWILVTLMVSE